MTYAFINQVDSNPGQAGVTIHTILENYKRVWVVISTADGFDQVIDPEGEIIDAFTLDTRLDGDANQLLAWFSDSV